MPLAIVLKKARNTAYGLGKIIHVGQEYYPEMIGVGPVETGTLHQ